MLAACLQLLLCITRTFYAYIYTMSLLWFGLTLASCLHHDAAAMVCCSGYLLLHYAMQAVNLRQRYAYEMKLRWWSDLCRFHDRRGQTWYWGCHSVVRNRSSGAATNKGRKVLLYYFLVLYVCLQALLAHRTPSEPLLKVDGQAVLSVWCPPTSSSSPPTVEN